MQAPLLPMVVMSVRMLVRVASLRRDLSEACAHLLLTKIDGLNVLKAQ